MTAAGLTAQQSAKDDISLAAWSLNRSFFVAHRWKNLDLPRICREEIGINGLEFVNQFFENPMLQSLQQLKRAGRDHGVHFVLIMCDGEGDMAAVNRAERMQSARAHRKWIDIGHFLGCHAIRCNLGGPRENWKQDRDLVQRARTGGLRSSELALMKSVNHPAFGTLPDFGNVNPGDDHAEVLRKLLPYAKGMSVKAGWNADGTHPRYDLEKLLRIAKEGGYHGFWGIESSFGRTRGQQEQLTHDQIWESEKRGVLLTKQVIERVVLNRS